MHLNLIQKMHALLVSDKVNIWHFSLKKDGPKYTYWLTDEPENEEGYHCWTLEGLIEAAYKHIDPSEKKLPAECPRPPHAKETDTWFAGSGDW